MRNSTVKFALSVIGLLTATGSIVGCCSPVTYGDTYQVVIDPKFSAEEASDIVAAMDDWSANVPVHLTAIVGDCSGVKEHVVCTHRATTSPESATTHSDCGDLSLSCTDGAEIVFPVGNIPRSFFQGVVGHELGHAMGLKHENDCMMAPNSGGDGWVMHVTPKDAAQWKAVR